MNSSTDRVRALLLKQRSHRAAARKRFAKLIVTAMAARETSVAEVAEKLSVPANLVYQWRIGRCVPRQQKLERLLDTLQLKLSAVEDALR